MTFIHTGEVQTLTPRNGSACLFFSAFIAGNDQIQLRLDWTALDINGQPTLDADFRDVETGRYRHSLKGRRRDVHHTSALPGDERCYMWAFMDVSHHFSVAVTWLATVSEKLNATDSCSATVLRGTSS